FATNRFLELSTAPQSRWMRTSCRRNSRGSRYANPLGGRILKIDKDNFRALSQDPVLWLRLRIRLPQGPLWPRSPPRPWLPPAPTGYRNQPRYPRFRRSVRADAYTLFQLSTCHSEHVITVAPLLF